jgi:cytoskeleton-associated protein 5
LALLWNSDSDECSKSNFDLKKFAGDSNIVAQEAALSALLAYVSSGLKPKSIVSPLLEKCVGSNRQGTRNKAFDILLMCVEVEMDVIPDIVGGLSSKQPKTVAAVTNLLSQIVKSFGRAVDLKIIVKSLSPLFSHADNAVRNEASNLALELYRWIGAPLESMLKDLKPIQIKELNELFAQNQEKPQILRYLRSQKPAVDKEMKTTENQVDEEESKITEEFTISAYDLEKPVEVLSKISEKTFALLVNY